MDQDLRCDSGILHGKLVDGMFEVKCRSNRCGYRRGVTVVLHRFDVATGDELNTVVLQEPKRGKERAHDNAHSIAVRAS